MSTVIPAPSVVRSRRIRLGIEPHDLDRGLGAGRGLVVDIRPAAAFDAGHIPRSLNASGLAWSAMTALLPPGSPVAVVAPTPYEAQQAASLLSEAGLDYDATVVSGGIDGWRRHGLRLHHGLALDARRALQQAQRGGVALIDVRTAGDFAVAHVVGSISVPPEQWAARGRELRRTPSGCGDWQTGAGPRPLRRAPRWAAVPPAAGHRRGGDAALTSTPCRCAARSPRGKRTHLRQA